MKKKSYTVAVTGFGPFREYDYNPSTSIRDGLPKQIIRKDRPSIHILKYPRNINCIYTEVLELCPQLWNGKRSVYEPDSASTKPVEIDLMIHIGMHPDAEGYFVEKRARRGRYEQPGDDGRFLARDALKGLPERFVVGLDLDGIVARVMKSVGVGLLFGGECLTALC
ncbi:MAG: hypothetical protein LQ352_004924 [Teloschistes flavicans]|nr:MAG: hypothetical protein LQ352_004924 [Teloschistes flavicans]